MNFGLNLFSLRKCIDTEEKFLDVALKLKEFGYSYLQYSGAEFDPQRIQRVSTQSGLAVVLTHVPMQRILEDTDALMRDHAVFGCQNIGLGAMPLSILADKELRREKIAALDAAAAHMEKNGFHFFYHHHHFEFIKDENGETVLEYMLKNAPHINFIADTYWMQFGGVNVLDFLDKMKGRIGCVHLKDYKIEVCELEGKLKANPRFAPLGEGTMDFPAIMKHLPDTQYYLVEQDDACNYTDPLGEVQKSANYLKKEF